MFSIIHNDITYNIFIPAYPVNLVVDHFVIMKGQGSHTRERLFPNNKAEIFFNLGDPVAGLTNTGEPAPVITSSIVSGLRNTFFDFYPPQHFHMAGMRFTLFGFNQLFNIPASHFTNHNFPAHEVWGKEMLLLQEQLCESPDNEGIIAILNDWVLHLLQQCSLQDITIWKKLENKLSDRSLSLSELLNTYMGYSNKHSIQLIKTHSGLKPKDIQKIIRFDETLKHISQAAIESWSGFAYAFGYADQSHFIREFKSFSGFTPLEYLHAKTHEYYFFKNQPVDHSAR